MPEPCRNPSPARRASPSDPSRGGAQAALPPLLPLRSASPGDSPSSPLPCPAPTGAAALLGCFWVNGTIQEQLPGIFQWISNQVKEVGLNVSGNKNKSCQDTSVTAQCFCPFRALCCILGLQAGDSQFTNSTREPQCHYSSGEIFVQLLSPEHVFACVFWCFVWILFATRAHLCKGSKRGSGDSWGPLEPIPSLHLNKCLQILSCSVCPVLT